MSKITFISFVILMAASEGARVKPKLHKNVASETSGPEQQGMESQGEQPGPFDNMFGGIGGGNGGGDSFGGGMPFGGGNGGGNSFGGGMPFGGGNGGGDSFGGGNPFGGGMPFGGANGGGNPPGGGNGGGGGFPGGGQLPGGGGFPGGFPFGGSSGNFPPQMSELIAGGEPPVKNLVTPDCWKAKAQTKMSMGGGMGDMIPVMPGDISYNGPERRLKNEQGHGSYVLERYDLHCKVTAQGGKSPTKEDLSGDMPNFQVPPGAKYEGVQDVAGVKCYKYSFALGLGLGADDAQVSASSRVAVWVRVEKPHFPVFMDSATGAGAGGMSVSIGIKQHFTDHDDSMLTGVGGCIFDAEVFDAPACTTTTTTTTTAPEAPKPTTTTVPDPAPKPPKAGARAHFTGTLMFDRFVQGWCSQPYVEDQYSEYVGVGEYPSNQKAFPNAIKSTFDGIAIDAGTRVTIYSKPNFEGSILFDKAGPAVLANSKYKDSTFAPDTRTTFNTKFFQTWAEPYQTIFPPGVRELSGSNMHLWASGSVKIKDGEPIPQALQEALPEYHDA